MEKVKRKIKIKTLLSETPPLEPEMPTVHFLQCTVQSTSFPIKGRNRYLACCSSWKQENCS